MRASSILLTTVFKPFGVDDRYGRRENVAEVLAAQVTRAQGIFTPRMWHATTGLHVVAANAGVPATVLEWPSLAEFEQELRQEHYDYVGISFIPCTVPKMRAMVEVVRRVSPRSRIVLGGYGTVVPHLDVLVEPDHICRGDGIRYLRNLLGESPEFAFRHPVVTTWIYQFLGLHTFPQPIGHIATGLGCAYGCDFCLTSAFFDCRYQPFLRSGSERFALIQAQARECRITDFWLMDENLLVDEGRAEELRSAAREHVQDSVNYNLDMIWSSADTVRRTGAEALAEMGVTSVWIGYESGVADYPKNRSIDFLALIDELAGYGINTLLSCVPFDDRHDEMSWESDLQAILRCGQAYTQFMPLSPLPTTKLYATLEAQDRLLEEIPLEERHGLTGLAHAHPRFSLRRSRELVQEAFEREYAKNGPSVLRILENRLRGYRTFQGSTSPVLRKRSASLGAALRKKAGFLLAMRSLVRECHRDRVAHVVEGFRAEFGTDFMNGLAAGAERLVGQVNSALDRRGGTETETLQPETRRTPYRPDDHGAPAAMRAPRGAQ
ncbi:MAG: cobalamin B12-binding domain-containing protein [Deltaproteobacteria bacterium]|nr:cobalamin B12-binding domain-containing protein [Deltaproteobacteria bacterium]